MLQLRSLLSDDLLFKIVMEILTAMSRPTSNDAAECARSKVRRTVELDGWFGLPPQGQLLGCHGEIEHRRLKLGYLMARS